MFKKKQWNSNGSISSAASYLSAVSEADKRARSNETTPFSTPPLSGSSSDSTGDGVSVEGEEIGNQDGLLLPNDTPGSNEVYTTVHTEFGHCANEEYRYTSQHDGGPIQSRFTDPPYYILITVYCTFILLIAIGHMRDFFGKRFRPLAYKHLMAHNVSLR